MQDTAWYRQWFGADYLQLYQHRSAEEARDTINWLILELGLKPPANILDLACGSGRHCRVLSQLGFTTCGLDLSWPLLEIERRSNSKLPFEATRGDMRQLPFKSGHFDLVISLFTSFGYFDTVEEDQQVLNEAARTLKSGGSYVLDFLNASSVASEVVPAEESEIEAKKVTIFRWIDEPKNRIEKRILIQESHGIVREFRESVKLYRKDELQGMLQLAGLSAHAVFGDYEGAKYNHNSPRLILMGRKDV